MPRPKKERIADPLRRFPRQDLASVITEALNDIQKRTEPLPLSSTHYVLKRIMETLDLTLRVINASVDLTIDEKAAHRPRKSKERKPIEKTAPQVDPQSTNAAP